MSHTYCQLCNSLPDDTDNPNKAYHQHEYGHPLTDDNALFERLVLEINQAGLNWTMILQKREAFRKAYAGFDIAAVAAFSEHDVARLLADSGIIRNRLKVQAAIFNARQILQLQQQYGSFHQWLEQHHPRSRSEWVALFKRHFKFMGNEIVGEFLLSTGYLPNAHDPDCPHATHRHSPS